ncbi:MAG TPA: hypothetical protein VG102_01930, partial [Candidatus Paceibacterota bacterium]|nr:hypothetical protein [Candidatus Paceibacterota bacterium]
YVVPDSVDVEAYLAEKYGNVTLGELYEFAATEKKKSDRNRDKAWRALQRRLGSKPSHEEWRNSSEFLTHNREFPIAFKPGHIKRSGPLDTRLSDLKYDRESRYHGAVLTALLVKKDDNVLREFLWG